MPQAVRTTETVETVLHKHGYCFMTAKDGKNAFLRFDKRNLVTEPPLDRQAGEFFKAAGFDIRALMFTNRYADLLISSKQTEFTKSYNFQGRILVRCFFDEVRKKDIDNLLRTLRHPAEEYRGLNFNHDISFMILDDAMPWQYLLSRMIEDSREIIIPIDLTVLARRNPSRPLQVTDKLVSESINTFLMDKGNIFREIMTRLDFFPQEKDLFFFIAEGLSEESELASLVSEPIDVALRHLIGYQIVNYKEGHYYIKINLLHRLLLLFIIT